jgi:hypothetical protein
MMQALSQVAAVVGNDYDNIREVVTGTHATAVLECSACCSKQTT